MRRATRTVLLVTLILAAGAERTLAAGLGGYLSGGGGKVKGEYDFDSVFDDVDIDGNAGYGGIGFLFELHPSGKSPFSYRATLGLESLKAELDFEHESFGPDFELAGVVTEHTFGFAVLRRETVRLWVGPQVRVGFYGGDGEIDFPRRVNLTGIRDADGDAIVAELGVGGVFGANFHFGDAFTLGAAAGVRVSGFGGINEYRSEEDAFSFGGGTFFFNLSFMARVGSDRG